MKLKELVESLVKSQSYNKNELDQHSLTGKYKARFESDLVKKHMLGHSRSFADDINLTLLLVIGHFNATI